MVVWRFGCRRSLLWGSSFVWSGRIVVIIVEERIFMCVEFDFKFSSFHVIALI